MIHLLAAVLLSASPAALATAPAATATPGRVVNRIAAVVNGDVITLRDLEDRAGPEWKAVEAQPAGPTRDKARRDLLRTVLDTLVSERLIEGQARELGVEITEAELDTVIDDVKKNNRLDDAGFERALAQEGLTLEMLRQRFRKMLVARKVIGNRLADRIKVADDDVKAYWQQHPGEFLADVEVRVRHVFLKVTSPADEARVRAVGAKVLARLQAGEDFAQVARETSEGPSAADGGDLGWVKRRLLEREVENAAFALEPGQTSGLVRARAGFHILRAEERRGGEPRPFDQVKDEIRARLNAEQAEGHQQQYVAELRKNALVEVNLPELQGSR
jgi:peptidyl-prolyl cis-trans isomerase SurA